MRAFSSSWRKISRPLGDSSVLGPPGQGPEEILFRFVIGGDGRLLHGPGDLGHLDFSHGCSCVGMSGFHVKSPI